MSASSSYQEALKRSEEVQGKIMQNPADFRVLTGERPTGKLHIGHLFGSILERKRLQDLGVQTYVIIADYQVITDRDELTNVQENVFEIVLDNLAAGLDPEETVFFTHSQIPELNQLVLPFLSLVSEAELHRNPTVKAELAAANDKGSRQMTGLMLTYPVHQAADILFCKGNVVPVGKDQLPHIEATRVIAKRFNERFCKVDYSQLDASGQPKGIERAIFPEPVALLSKTPHIPGLDGRKMSKSFGNTITLSMTEDETAAIISKAQTDSTREVSFDPENRLEVSSLLTICALMEGLETGGVGEKKIAEEINSAPNYGAGLLKKRLTEVVNERLRDHRAKRNALLSDRGYIKYVLHHGINQAREDATKTLKEVQEAMGTVY
jgi:tryptophanyl-tRNA synthetase